MKKIKGGWNWQKKIISWIISNKKNNNQKNKEQNWKKNKLKSCFEKNTRAIMETVRKKKKKVINAIIEVFRPHVLFWDGEVDERN